MPDATAPLAGVRVVDVSMLGPGALTTHLADLGADVIKVEPPGGEYVRRMVWPFIHGVSLLHWHISRGKRSIELDLRTDAGIEVFRELVRGADAVVEAMRPGALDRRGLGFAALREINPKIVMCSISGYGASGPYRDLPSHGIAYDTWAGVVKPAVDDDGFTYLPEHASIGIHAGPLFGAFALVAAVLAARETGQGSHVEVGQADAAAAMDWLRSESWRAYERPEDEVTGNPVDNYERRTPGTAGMEDGVRYQIYPSADGHILFMASERKFWRNFCEGVGRLDLFERRPGAEFADHARGDTETRVELVKIFATRTTAEWIRFAGEHNTTIAPVNTPKSIMEDPQFRDRLPWLPASKFVIDQLPFPVRFDGRNPEPQGPAPSPGEDSAEVLAGVLGYDEAKVASLRAAGAFGKVADADGGADADAGGAA
ncbi:MULTISPECIES: CaiB/BaiF CoA transferase family protein [Pseudofrankia]|uniref:CaiB/BaiF CoA transferase family protein n=1 Tax=Pseudofrankia TaxID=2994363 RepID=UPI000234B3E6|nr:MULTISPECIES: CaiB/BaiF CoA-transferase family protein [Pseudofrankia]OHV39313.1 carnitine dehydratase [Pseudofrankia sp. EUN1h]